MHRTQPGDGDTGRTPTSRAQQAPDVVQATRVEIGLQQRKRDKIVLSTTAANSFGFARERFERVDRGGEVSLLERDETARQGGQVRTGWVSSFARQLLPMLDLRAPPRVIRRDGLRQDDVQVRQPIAGSGQRAARIVM